MRRWHPARILPLLLLATQPLPLGGQTEQTATASWRDGGVCYEIFVRSFFDSDGDGIGDFNGLTRKLDYINDGDPETTGDLGANCLWLMPIMPSPSYHGYDVTDYTRVNPSYGTNQDFKDLVVAAHQRGIRVLIDMVPNHSSSEHPWFLDAALRPDSPYRDWYRWSDVQGPRNEWGGYNWHHAPYGDDYYYGFFSPVMPDLNWETPEVAEEMNRIADFWLQEMGVDGFRLDAVRHLMEDGARTANVPATHQALAGYGEHVRTVAPDAFTVGEVFDSTDVLRSYYPDQLDAYFAFQVANAILDAVVSGTSEKLLAAVDTMQDIAPNDRWAPFLRNHDQSRTMTWLQGDVPRNKLAATLLLTLPGVPFVYYGEELGMTGDKPDPRIRTPMHWTRERAAGFTTGLPWEPLQPDSFTANVEVLDRDPSSLLNHYRRLINLRATTPGLGKGTFVALDAGTSQVAAYLRQTESGGVLVVANLGETPLRDVSVSSRGAVLGEGAYDVESLLDGAPDPLRLTVGSGGRIQAYLAAASLPPLQARILQFRRRPGGSR